MLKKDQKLNPDIFKKGVKKTPLRDGFGEGLLEAGKKDERVVGLCADLTGSTRMKAFAEEFPERFVEIGVAEQDLATVASGMAAMGKIPFISSYAMFSPGRNWEQIRTTITYNNRPVKIAGSHAGVSVGPDGGTHQAVEDIAITRVLPRMHVLTPCDAIEAKKATLAAAKTSDPTYIRLAREGTPIVTTEDTPFEIGKSAVFFEPKKGAEKEIGIVACGTLMHHALTAAQEMEKDGVGVSVLNLGTVKPLDEKGILKFAKEHKVILTVEEHQAAGGMGSAVAEFLVKTHPLPMDLVGVNDEYGESGDPEELIEHFELDAKAIRKRAIKLLNRL